MTKLISLRVIVPADDDVTTEDCATFLRKYLEVLPSALAEGKRMHWLAVDVVRSVVRAAETVPRRPRKPVAGKLEEAPT